MKTKIVFLIVLNWSVGYSQAVFAPVKGAKWTYIYRSTAFVNGISSNTNGVIKATYSKDTIVEGKNYKLIILNYGILDITNNSITMRSSFKFIS